MLMGAPLSDSDLLGQYAWPDQLASVPALTRAAVMSDVIQRQRLLHSLMDKCCVSYLHKYWSLFQDATVAGSGGAGSEVALELVMAQMAPINEARLLISGKLPVCLRQVNILQDL